MSGKTASAGGFARGGCDTGREEYRREIRILRRAEDGGGTGGYAPDELVPLARVSCGVRDEGEAEWAQNESARRAHIKTFVMRARDVRNDDVILWRGDAYRVRQVDAYRHKGREIRVRAECSTSAYTVRGDNVCLEPGTGTTGEE